MSGEFPAGSRLPGLGQLRREMFPQMSMTIFHRGIRTLTTRGFLEANARSHTRVKEELPNRNQFAVVLPRDPTLDFPTALLPVIYEAAENYCHRNPGLHLEYHIYDHKLQGHAARLALLQQRVIWHEIAGIWFLCALWEHEPFYNEPGLARVQFVPPAPFKQPWMERFAHTQSPAFGQGDFLGISIRRIAEEGLKSVAIVRPLAPGDRTNTSNMNRPAWEPIVSEIRKSGLETRPEWLLNVEGSGWETGRLLMCLPERPDALIIEGDYLVQSITAGIASMPQPWPRTIGQANFPKTPDAAIPCVFAGFDIREMTNWSLDSLSDPVRQNEIPANPLRARFADGWQPPG